MNHICAILGASALMFSSTARAQEDRGSLHAVVRSMFAESPAFQVYDVRTRQADATRMTASGAFDVVASAALRGTRTSLPGPYGAPTDESYSTLGAHAELSTQLRENVSLRLGGDYPLRSTIDAWSSPLQPQATASLTIPLLKFGRAAGASGAERAAALHASASAAAQLDAEAALVALVAESYWLWVGSYEQVKVTRKLDQIARDQLRDVDALIEQQARPINDRLVIAAAADTAAATLGQAEQAMFAQQQALGQLLGVTESRVWTAPSVPFPDVPPPPDGRAVAERAHRSARARAIYRALRDEVAAALTREEAAEIAKRPDVNLVAEGVVGRVQDLRPEDSRLGYSGNVALQFALPIPNRAARGAHELAIQLRFEEELSSAQRRNAIDARVDALGNTLATLARTCRQRVDANAAFEGQYEAERAKFRLGTATAIDVVLAEQQYTVSSLAVVAERTSYAVALARLLYESGALEPAMRSRNVDAVVDALTSTTL